MPVEEAPAAVDKVQETKIQVRGRSAPVPMSKGRWALRDTLFESEYAAPEYGCAAPEQPCVAA